jgi:hypothetical protein
MYQQNDPRLQQAYHFINTGRMEEALDVLNHILAVERFNVEAWRLIALAVPNPDDKRAALSTVLQFQPDDVWARELLHRLDSRPVLARPFGGAFVTNRTFPLPDYEQPTYVSGGGRIALPSSMNRYRAPRRRPQNALFTLMTLFVVLVALAGGLLILLLFVGSNIELATATTVAPIVAKDAPGVDIDAAAQPASNPAVHDRGTLEINRWVRGALSRLGDHNIYQFEGAAGQFIVVELTVSSGSFTPVLDLYAPNSDLLARSGNVISGENRTMMVSHTLTEPGVYRVVVSSAESVGAYQLLMRRN